jgi:hypothetical protein
MSELVERLRAVSPDDYDECSAIMNEAAARIEKLEAALRDIADCKTYTDRKYMIDLARAALKETP